MTDSLINRELCRFCGCKNEQGRSLNNKNSAELLIKVKQVFPILVIASDPFPNRICSQCEEDVNAFYIKLQRFQALQENWCKQLKICNPIHPYLEKIQRFLKQHEMIRSYSSNFTHEMTQAPEVASSIDTITSELNIDRNDLAQKHGPEVASSIDTITSELNIDLAQKQMEKERERRRRQHRNPLLMGYVRCRKFKRKIKTETGLKPANIETTVDAIPKSEPTFKNRRKTISYEFLQNEIIERRTRMNRRASQPFMYEEFPKQNALKKMPKQKIKLESIANQNLKMSLLHEYQDQSNSMASTSRLKRRIKYSKELVDQAFIHEQMLHDKQLQPIKNAKINTEYVNSPLQLLKQRNDITIKPLKSVEKSSVSTHIKSKNNFQISQVTSLNGTNETKANTSINCNYCNEWFSDEKCLSIHQLQHLKVSAYKLGTKEILLPALRRGRILNLNDQKYIRCVNCWKLHTNNKSILDHWNTGNCKFYCRICGESFHNDIKSLNVHVRNMHKISLRRMNFTTMLNKQTIKNIQLMQSDTKCTICQRKFIHRRALRAHITMLHKKRQAITNSNKNTNSIKSTSIKPLSNNASIKAKITQLNEKHGPIENVKENVTKLKIRSNVNEKKLQNRRETDKIIESLLSQDQTISSTYLSTATSNKNVLEIKTEPIESIEQWQLPYNYWMPMQIEWSDNFKNVIESSTIKDKHLFNLKDSLHFSTIDTLNLTESNTELSEIDQNEQIDCSTNKTINPLSDIIDSFLAPSSSNETNTV